MTEPSNRLWRHITPLDKHRSIERYHLTLKKWLRKKPAAATLAELQVQIDRFVHIYNEERVMIRHLEPLDCQACALRSDHR